MENEEREGERNYKDLFRWWYFQNRVTTFLKVLVIVIGIFHAYHVSTMFENDTFFSHLNNLEREMVFRSEMGMYYSYYKRIVEAPSYMDGLYGIINDNRTEHPSVINSLQRFNLYPEVINAGLFRIKRSVDKRFNVTSRHCCAVNRTFDIVTACVGVGEPVYFYLLSAWVFAGLAMGILTLYGWELSESLLGGLIAALTFMYNHSEATRVQWTPPLRETFGYPLGLIQMLVMTKFLRFANSWRANTTCYSKLVFFMLINIPFILIPTVMFLVTWQFGQFVILTQVCAIFLLYLTAVIDKRTFLVIVGAIFGSVLVSSAALFLNEFLLYSILTCATVAMITVVSLASLLPGHWCNNPWLEVILVAVGTASLKLICPHGDDAHIFNLFRAKLTNYKDFHTLLYTCSPEFDFLTTDYAVKICLTLLLPTALVVIFAVIYYWTTNVYRVDFPCRDMVRFFVDPGIAYTILQASAFGVMAIMVMRLKLFLTPHLCLLCSMLFHRRLFYSKRFRPVIRASIVVIIGMMSVQGIHNITKERNIIGEYNNRPLEDLLTWVNNYTPPDSVFAGPMPLMANIMLSTGRKVVNHPHYEHADARRRTYLAYSIFSKKGQCEAFDLYIKMDVNYVITEDLFCFGINKKGCSMTDLWDIEDPVNAKNEPLCPRLFNKRAFPFRKVYGNRFYMVFAIDKEWSKLTESFINVTINHVQ